MTHTDWFTVLVGSASVNAAARKSGIVQTTLDGQVKRGTLRAESVIKLARAYGANPVQGLVDTGYLEPDEAQGEIQVINWSDVSDAELCKELLDRCDPDGSLSRATWDGPLDDEAITEIEGAAPTVRTQLRAAPQLDRAGRLVDLPADLAAHRPGYDPDDEITD